MKMLEKIGKDQNILRFTENSTTSVQKKLVRYFLCFQNFEYL